MSRASICCVTIGGASRGQRDQIENHVAWKNNIREGQAELLLEGQAPFSYVLRRGEQEDAYFITFMTKDGTAKHRRFVFELDSKKWCYRNGGAEAPTETFSDTLDELIPLIMGYKPKAH